MMVDRWKRKQQWILICLFKVSGLLSFLFKQLFPYGEVSVTGDLIVVVSKSCGRKAELIVATHFLFSLTSNSVKMFLDELNVLTF